MSDNTPKYNKISLSSKPQKVNKQMLGIFPSSRFPHAHKALDMNDAVRYITLNMDTVFLT